MGKTAAIILNHNLPDYTDMLYGSLKPCERDDYDLFVLDNGSKPEGTSKHTAFKLDTNVYFGGGFNAAMQFIKENPQYDSLLFLNNDLTVHPYEFVRTLREEMFNGNDGFGIATGGLYDARRGMDEQEQSEYRRVMEEETLRIKEGRPPSPRYDIVSPTFYNIEPNQQCHWKAMHSQCSRDVRQVDYIDFQCPLISRRLIEAVNEIDSDLMYGWGVDWLFALTAKKNNWKLGVVDRCCMLHHNSLTVKRGVAGLDIPTYCRLAEQGMATFFKKSGMMDSYINLRQQVEKYDYTK